MEIAAINPTDSMMAIQNDVVTEAAALVGEQPKKAPDRLWPAILYLML
jgi:hypothetical protein